MTRIKLFVRAGVIAGVVVAAYACTEAAKVQAPAFSSSIFDRYVALGNSITAGYQSGGINDSTQQLSYAAMLAAAMQTRYAYPSLAKPGCPPPVANFFTGALVSGVPAGSCFLRNPSTASTGLATLGVQTTPTVAYTITGGSFTLSGFQVGQIVVGSGFSNAANNTVSTVTAVSAATLTVTPVNGVPLVAEAASAATPRVVYSQPNQALLPDALNNVAVPGATAEDPDSVVGPGASALTEFILGGKTQVARALDAKPTFTTIWIGNNDVLGPAISGFVTPVAPFSAGITPEATFEASYNKMMTDLLAGAPNLKGVLIGVANVLDIPVFFPVSALANANFVTTLNNYTGKTIVVDPTTCPPGNTANNGNLIAFNAIQAIKAGTLAGSAYPALIECAHNAATAPVGDVFVLTTAGQTAVTNAIAGYNTFIKGVAAAKGFAYVDPNAALDSLKNQGFRVPSAFTGGTAAGGNITTGSTTLWADATSYNRSAGSFLTNGFYPGQLVTASGFTTAANNGTAIVTAVSALKLTVSKLPQTTLTTPTDSGTGRTILSAPGFGPYFSFDGIHPTVNAHTLITNYIINAINAFYHTSIPNLPNPTI